MKQAPASDSTEAGPAAAAAGPLYEQVLQSLRAEIVQRQYGEAGPLPSESALMERFGVSRITVRRALDELARAGYVERSRGRATRVVAQVPPTIIDLNREISSTLARSVGMTIRVLNFKWVRATHAIADALRLPAGSKVMWVSRLRSREDQPVVHTSVHLPEEFGRLLDRKELGHTQLLDVLRSHGKIPASAEQVLSAAPCPEALAALLGLLPAEPIFRLERVVLDAQSRPMLHLESSFRWDCIGYRMSLRQDAFDLSADVEPHVSRLLQAR